MTEQQKPEGEHPQETEHQKQKRLNREEQQRLLNERIEAGKAGKLWKIDVLYEVGAETRHHYLENRYSTEVMEFREEVFKKGIMVIVSPGEWVIVPPWRIRDILVTRQPKYWDQYV